MVATAGSMARSGRSAAIAPIATGCCLVAGAVYVTAQDPATGGMFAPCPFRSLTGWWCPGCGLTRATHHAFRGDIVQALRYNVFVVVVLAGFASLWCLWLASSLRTSMPTRTRPPSWVAVIAIFALVGFAVVRNLPGIDGLRG